MFSANEEKEWVGITSIFGGVSTSYTDMIEVEAGKLFVVYDSAPDRTNIIPCSGKLPKHGIYGKFVEVQTLR